MALQIADRVKESTITTGTGPLTLAGAATGYRRFSSVCSTNDTCYYAIEAVDGNGVATGDWETGLGTYSAANTLTRTTVNASSNAGSAVNFSGGTKNVWIDQTATAIGLYAPLASPTFTGTATAPTFTATTKFLAAEGTAGAPSYAFSSQSNCGLYSNTGSGFWGMSNAGAAIAFLSGTTIFGFTSGVTFGWTNTTAPGTLDLVLARDGIGILAQKNGNAAQESRIYAGNGGFLSNVKSVTESLTIAAAATTDSATTIPAGAILLAVAVRVTTVIPTAATFTVTTTTGGTTLNTAAVSTAANSTDPGTAAGASYRAASTTIRITPNLTPAAATGVVRLNFYYLQVTPPTS